jgi:hypothetical protein
MMVHLGDDQHLEGDQRLDEIHLDDKSLLEQVVGDLARS